MVISMEVKNFNVYAVGYFGRPRQDTQSELKYSFYSHNIVYPNSLFLFF